MLVPKWQCPPSLRTTRYVRYLAPKWPLRVCLSKGALRYSGLRITSVRPPVQKNFTNVTTPYAADDRMPSAQEECDRLLYASWMKRITGVFTRRFDSYPHYLTGFGSYPSLRPHPVQEQAGGRTRGSGQARDLHARGAQETIGRS